MNLKQYKSKQKQVSKQRLQNEQFPNELIIVAEGDSWFDYPLKKDIIDYLIHIGYGVKKLAKAGDTLENMVYGSEYSKKGNVAIHKGPLSIQKTLNAVKNYKAKFLIFSAGGNDIVGEEIISYLNHANSKPKSLINKVVFEAKLQRMMEAIEFFIKGVHKTNKDTQIIMDGYDYAKPNGKGYNFIFRNIKGPWILPSMAMKAITQRKEQDKIIKYFVDEFNNNLKILSDKYPYFHYLDLRNKFPNEKEWDNEIHLKNSGFKKVAHLYHSKICEILGYNPIIENKNKIIA